jgi:23S rRNA pseudouridine1911/1915/1917 synthase
MAVLTFRVVGASKSHTLLKVFPKTGRPHQIRAQLSKENLPIAGDLKYGYSKPNPDKSISLHAYKLTFEHPVKRETFDVISKPRGGSWEEYQGLLHELD